MTTKYRIGDYVEVLPDAGNVGVEDGEQGMVVKDDSQDRIGILFPANNELDDLWSEDDGSPWRVPADGLKLVCRLRRTK